MRRNGRVRGDCITHDSNRLAGHLEAGSAQPIDHPAGRINTHSRDLRHGYGFQS